MGYRPEVPGQPAKFWKTFLAEAQRTQRKKKLCEITSQRHARDCFLRVSVRERFMPQALLGRRLSAKSGLGVSGGIKREPLPAAASPTFETILSDPVGEAGRRTIP